MRIFLTREQAQDLQRIVGWEVSVPKMVARKQREIGERLPQERIERLSDTCSAIWQKLEAAGVEQP